MKLTSVAFLALASCIGVLAPEISKAEVSCTRGGLQQAVDLYVSAQTKGDISGLPLAKNVGN